MPINTWRMLVSLNKHCIAAYKHDVTVKKRQSTSLWKGLAAAVHSCCSALPHAGLHALLTLSDQPPISMLFPCGHHRQGGREQELWALPDNPKMNMLSDRRQHKLCSCAILGSLYIALHEKIIFRYFYAVSTILLFKHRLGTAGAKTSISENLFFFSFFFLDIFHYRISTSPHP